MGGDSLPFFGTKNMMTQKEIYSLMVAFYCLYVGRSSEWAKMTVLLWPENMTLQKETQLSFSLTFHHLSYSDRNNM